MCVSRCVWCLSPLKFIEGTAEHIESLLAFHCSLLPALPSTASAVQQKTSLYKIKQLKLLTNDFHPSPLHHLSMAGSQWQQAEQDSPDTQQHLPAPPGGSSSVPKPDEICNPSSLFLVHLRVSYQLDVPRKPPKGGAQKASSCQNTSADSFPQEGAAAIPRARMCELLTLSLRVSLATLNGKIISIVCICDVILSVTTQSLRS